MEGLTSGVVVLNKKYFPRNSSSAAQVGATSFALSVLQVLYDARILCGIVLYQRDESLQDACCSMMGQSFYEDIPVITVSFNFRMPQLFVTRELNKAYLQASNEMQRSRVPIIYYQTDTL
jgi:hypothetical protein